MLILEVSKCSFVVAINMKFFSVYIQSILEDFKIVNLGVIKAWLEIYFWKL